jgi:acyl carrier protein
LVKHDGGRASGEATEMSAALLNTVDSGRTRAGAAPNAGVAAVVRRMLMERSLDEDVTADADLREIGLTSLDMVDLVLSVECAFDLQIPEAAITPANFRSIATIDALLAALRG